MAGEIDFRALSPGVNYAQMIQSFGAGQDARAQRTQQGLQKVQLDRQVKADQREDNLRAGTAAAFDTATGEIDPVKARQAFATAGDLKGALSVDDFIRTAKTAKLDYALAENKAGLQIIGSALDQPSYAAALGKAQALGIDTSRFPPQFDPGFIRQAERQALDTKERLELERREAQQEEAARHNRATETLTVRGQDRASADAAAGRAVTLNGQALTDARARESNSISATGALPPKEARRATIQLRKEFDSLPEVKAFKDLAPVIVSARKAPDTPAGDILLAYTVGKVLDPSSVVREGELAMVAKAGSPLERVIGAGRFAAGQGARLTKNQRTELLDMLNERALANRQAYDAARSNFQSYASESGVNPTSVVGTHVANAYASSKPPRPPATVKNDADFDRLRPGSVYVGPDGVTRRKK